MHPVTQYAWDVVHGKLRKQCGELEILACERHLKDLKRVGKKDFPYVFDETRADRIIRWFRECRHVMGVYAGQPIELLDWQQFDYGCPFGWVHKDNGKRRFKTAYIREARGHAKSTGMSGVALYGMCSDAIYPPGHPELAQYEAEPHVVCGAVDKEQARIVWDGAKNMAVKSPEIKKRLIIKKSYIAHRKRGGEIMRLSKDVHNKDGGNPCIIIIDEYHEHQTSYVKDTTASGKGKRRQCLEFIITTAGKDAENKPCYKEDQTAIKILRGEIVVDDYFVMIRQIDDKDNLHDKKCWVKANPLFRDLSNEYAKDLYDEVCSSYELAYGSGDYSKILEWNTKRVNRWQASVEHKYLAGYMDKFKKLAVKPAEFRKLTQGMEAYQGIDLSKKIDLTADAYVIPLRDGRFAFTAHGYIPQEAANRHEQTDRVTYKAWAKEKWCSLTPGAVTDFSFIEARMHQQEKRREWNIKEICYDPYQATQYAQDREKEGYTCVEIRQGVATLSEPTKTFREYILSEKLVHDGSPLMIWCFSNAVEETDSNGNIKLKKKVKDDSQRIDLAAAVINAFVRALTHEFDDGDLFYAPDI